jgi:hypothetical protein
VDPGNLSIKGGYLCIWDPKLGRGPVLYHRLIWFQAYGHWPRRVDHINGEKLDNRLENLREVTKEQDSQNRRSKHLFKGIYFDKSRQSPKKYRVRVQKNGRRWYIGAYLTEPEARVAAIAAIKRLHGAYAAHRLGAVVNISEIPHTK